MRYNCRLAPSPLKPGTKGLKRSTLANKSAKQRGIEKELAQAYAAADDADQEWCSVCGKAGPVEHSHLYGQGTYPEHRNDQRNWLQVGKWCGCHTTYEHNKALFAKKWPKVWAEIIRRMRLIDPKAYDFYSATIPELYPD